MGEAQLQDLVVRLELSRDLGNFSWRHIHLAGSVRGCVEWGGWQSGNLAPILFTSGSQTSACWPASPKGLSRFLGGSSQLGGGEK